MPKLLLVLSVAAILVLHGPCPSAESQQSVPKVCDSASDVAALVDCARKHEPDRIARCASAKPAPMSWPAPGEVLQAFGVATKYGAVSKGLVIATPSEASVRSPVAGIVLFAGPFRSFGQLVVIDACTHDILLAGMSRIDVPLGHLVAKDHLIGAMAKTTSDTPVLYIEARNDGRPVDPALLLGPR